MKSARFWPWCDVIDNSADNGFAKILKSFQPCVSQLGSTLNKIWSDISIMEGGPAECDVPKVYWFGVLIWLS